MGSTNPVKKWWILFDALAKQLLVYEESSEIIWQVEDWSIEVNVSFLLSIGWLNLQSFRAKLCSKCRERKIYLINNARTEYEEWNHASSFEWLAH